MTGRETSGARTPREDRILLLLFLVPVASWSAAFGVGAVLSGWVCGSGQRWVLPVVLAAAFAATASAGAGCLRRLRASRRGSSNGDVAARRRFLEAGGVLVSLICLLAILALAIPAVLHRPCD